VPDVNTSFFASTKNVTPKLRESEEKYLSLFDNMLDGFALNKMEFNKVGESVVDNYLRK
jgi:hypothetical protein